MEKVFESYVAKQLKKTLADLNWEISSQDKGYYLFDSPRQFALRPDIVITGTGSSDCNRPERIILDTKWKRLVNDRGRNYGISQADMYQMFAYAQKYETPEIWLVYPLSREMRFFGEISFESVGAAGNTSCAVSVFPVDLTRFTASLEELLARIEERLSRRRAFAHPDYSG
jgi:5-methylcytosine-specific restriction enzyme subunit McrC